MKKSTGIRTILAATLFLGLLSVTTLPLQAEKIAHRHNHGYYHGSSSAGHRYHSSYHDHGYHNHGRHGYRYHHTPRYYTPQPSLMLLPNGRLVVPRYPIYY